MLIILINDNAIPSYYYFIIRSVREEILVVIEKRKIRHVRIQRKRLSQEELRKRNHEYYIKNRDMIKQRTLSRYQSLSEEQKQQMKESREKYAKECFKTCVRGTPKQVKMNEKCRAYNERHIEEVKNKAKQRY